MYLSAEKDITWSETTVFLGMLVAFLFLVGFGMASWLEYRKLKVTEQQTDGLRQLVQRYEQLAENTMDAQQRTAADVAELRTRAVTIEQILRSVE